MKFKNESIKGQMAVQLGGLEKGINKIKTGYPNISGFNNIEGLLRKEERFPDLNESLTGSSGIFIKTELIAHKDTLGYFYIPDYRSYMTRGPFSNEEWDALIFNTHYPFPDQYRLDSRVQEALSTMLNVQQAVLSSSALKDYKRQIESLPKLTAENIIGSPSGEYLVKELGEPVDFTNINIDRILRGIKKRLQQISYSLVEAQCRNQIIEKIGDPMMKVRQEILDIIENGGEFESLIEKKDRTSLTPL